MFCFGGDLIENDLQELFVPLSLQVNVGNSFYFV